MGKYKNKHKTTESKVTLKASSNEKMINSGSSSASSKMTSLKNNKDLSQTDPLEVLESMTNAMEEMKTLLLPLFKALDTETEETLIFGEEEITKLKVSLAYSMNTLYHIHMKANQCNLDDDHHPIAKEINRLKAYMSKLKKLYSSRTDTQNEKKIHLNVPGAVQSIKSALYNPELH